MLLEALVRIWTLYTAGDVDHRTTFALLMTSKAGVRRVAARKAPLTVRVVARDAAVVSHRAPPLDARLDAQCFRVRWEVDDSAEPEHNPCSWLHVPMPMADLASRLSRVQISRVRELCRDDSPFVILSEVGLFRDGCTHTVTDKATLRVFSETQIAALQCCITCARSLKGARKCGGCRRATYCSRECQIKDWKDGHKSVCVSGRAGEGLTATSEPGEPAGRAPP